VIGESNQFVAGGRGQGQYGTSTVNLRGLGPERTLTLFNGHRLPLAFALAPDPNVLPLSPSAAWKCSRTAPRPPTATDAIGGVVNFVTKRTFEGLEVGGDYPLGRRLQGRRLHGQPHLGQGRRQLGRADLGRLSASQRAAGPRQELGPQDLYDLNPEGGWTGGGNPESFTPSTATGTPLAGGRLDLGCTALGGQLTTANANAAPAACPDELPRAVLDLGHAREKEDRYQAFGQLNWKFAGNNELHLDAAYGYTQPAVLQVVALIRDDAAGAAGRDAHGLRHHTAADGRGTAGLVAGLFRAGEQPGLRRLPGRQPGAVPGRNGRRADGRSGRSARTSTGGNPLYNYQHGVGGPPTWHDQILFDAGVKGRRHLDHHLRRQLRLRPLQVLRRGPRTA